jgi:2,4-dienoyl-CoA reductase-like NADH-dependent reductase (Old Yellow Enzyme family)
MEEYRRLFTPIKVGSLQISNRIVVPPMVTGLASEDWTVTQALIDYWVARAKGGWRLVVLEFTSIDPSGKWSARPLLVG